MISYGLATVIVPCCGDPLESCVLKKTNAVSELSLLDLQTVQATDSSFVYHRQIAEFLWCFERY